MNYLLTGVLCFISLSSKEIMRSFSVNRSFKIAVACLLESAKMNSMSKSIFFIFSRKRCW